MRKLAIASLALVAAAVTRASAQVSSPITYKPSVYAGIAFPNGDTSDGLNTGYTVGAAVDVGMMMPVSFRAEGSYTRFDATDNHDGTSGNLNDVSGRINAVLGVPMAGFGFSPYVIGGIGIYRVTANFNDIGFSDNVSQNKFGWNIGGGIDMPIGEIAGRLEVRYHRVSLDNGINYTYVPITFGIRF